MTTGCAAYPWNFESIQGRDGWVLHAQAPKSLQNSQRAHLGWQENSTTADSPPPSPFLVALKLAVLSILLTSLIIWLRWQTSLSLKSRNCTRWRTWTCRIPMYLLFCGAFFRKFHSLWCTGRCRVINCLQLSWIDVVTPFPPVKLRSAMHWVPGWPLFLGALLSFSKMATSRSFRLWPKSSKYKRGRLWRWECGRFPPFPCCWGALLKLHDSFCVCFILKSVQCRASLV